MPVVKPVVTGYGMNLISFPKPETPMITRMMPAIIVAVIKPPIPCSAMMPAMMTTKAPVGPDTW